MTAAPPLDITLLPADAASNSDLVGELTDLVNRVYHAAEDGLWTDDANRTTTTEMARVIADGENAVARAVGLRYRRR